MNRRIFIAGAMATLTSRLTAEAQQSSDKVWRITSVLAGSQETTGHLAKAIEASLASAGYVHGRNITLMQEFSAPQPANFEAVLKKVVPNTDLLLVGSTIGGVAAKQATTTLPTVFLSVGDPVRVGLVSSLAHPGGNMTGITFEAAAETYGKRLQLLKEMLPGLTVVGVLRVPGDANIIVAMTSLERVAPALRVTLRSFDVKTPEDLNVVFATMTRDRVQAVLVVAGAFTFTHGRRIAELALTHRLPSAHAFSETVAEGGLMSLGPDLVEMARQAATLVEKIIKGAKPADLPVEQPARYEMHLNLKTAKALGLTIPPSLLQRADQVIE
jgi:putative ABC transport system substrate-binding protein